MNNQRQHGRRYNTKSFFVLLIGVFLIMTSGLLYRIQASSMTKGAASTFLVTSFYTPTGWMLNSVDTTLVNFSDTITTDCVDAGPCIRISWTQPQVDEWIGLYWLHPDADGHGGTWPAIGQPGCNLSGATSVTVWARGEQGGEKIAFLAGFYAGNGIETPSVTLTKEWEQHTINVSSLDLSNVVGAFGYVVSGNENPSDITFYLDEIIYNGVDPSQLACLADQSTVTPTATIGSTATPTATPIATTVIPSTPTATPTEIPSEHSSPLVLVYAVLDNNLGKEFSGNNWDRLINNLEAGVHDGVKTRLLIDAPGPDNSYLYDLVSDTRKSCPDTLDMSCGQQYIDGQNRQIWTEDTAHPKSLYNFIKQSFEKYPNPSQAILIIVGHGSGWSANGLPSQPTRWSEQFDERIGGMLWDDTLEDGSGSNSLSTRALGEALQQATDEVGRKFDLLYFDACSMGVVEVAYEVRDSAKYLLASPNTDWASYAFDMLLPQVTDTKSGRTLGQEWLAIEAGFLRRERYPFTLSLLDLDNVTPLMNATTELANALTDELPEQSAELARIFRNVDHYESNYDGTLTEQDTYADLHSITVQLAQHFAPSSPVNQATLGVQTALTNLVVTKDVESGSPWTHPEQVWKWDHYGGLSIYLPIPFEDRAKRLLYVNSNLQWAEDGKWDDFLASYWQDSIESASGENELPTCISTDECISILAQPLPTRADDLLFLPLIQR